MRLHPARSLRGVAKVNQRAEQLFESARLARTTGQGWLELAALAWLVHLGAGRARRNLHRLLRATGWRTIPLVPREVAASVATRLAADGFRSTALVEFAVASRDEKAVADVAGSHLEDPRAGGEWHGVAAAALARVGQPGARALLRSIAQSQSPAAGVARAALAKRADRVGLSEREGEVLRLAASGRTNAEIASTLVISPHTVARHVENSRTKLGASNRAEAVARWLSPNPPIRGRPRRVARRGLIGGHRDVELRRSIARCRRGPVRDEWRWMSGRLEGAPIRTGPGQQR